MLLVLRTVNDSFDWRFGMVLCFPCQGFCVHIMTLLKGANIVFSVRKLTNYPCKHCKTSHVVLVSPASILTVQFLKCIYTMLGQREL